MKRLATVLALRSWCWVAALGGLAGAHLAARADVPAQELKAKVIARALLFAQWPTAALQPGQTLIMCLAEDHPLAAAIALQDGQMINGHRLQLRRGANDPSRQCNVALVGPHERAPMAQRRQGLLRVGDVPGGLKDGVMVNVEIESGRVVFDVNLKTAREDGLDIDTRLLRLARFVQQE
jgi:hypothetical protein